MDDTNPSQGLPFSSEFDHLILCIHKNKNKLIKNKNLILGGGIMTYKGGILTSEGCIRPSEGGMGVDACQANQTRGVAKGGLLGPWPPGE